MNNDGYIHTHRSDPYHWTWKNPVHYQWWTDIRLEVNYRPGGCYIKGKHIECGRGQSIRSYASWANRWCVDRNRVRRFFDLLIAHNEISIEVIPNRTIRLTVLNYNYCSPQKDPYKSTTAMDTEYQRTLSGPLESEKRTPYTPTGTMDTEYQRTLSSKKTDPIEEVKRCLTENSSLNFSSEQDRGQQSPDVDVRKEKDSSKYDKLSSDLKTPSIKPSKINWGAIDAPPGLPF